MKRLWMTLLLMGCSAVPEALLTAPDQPSFNEALKVHGPVRDTEVSALISEASGQNPVRAYNALQLLSLSRSQDAQAALERIGATTPDPRRWACAASSLLVREELGQGKFPA